MVPERRAAEAPATQVAQVSDNIGPACKDMLELRTSGVLDTEKDQDVARSAGAAGSPADETTFGILEMLPGCKRGATSAERAVDIVRWLQTRSTN